MSDEALDRYNSVVEAAILKALDEGGPDAVREFLTALVAVFGPDVYEHVAGLTEGQLKTDMPVVRFSSVPSLVSIFCISWACPIM